MVISAAYGPNAGGVATHVVNLVSGLVKWFDDISVDVLTLRGRGMGYKKDSKGRLVEWKLDRRTEPEFNGRRLVLGRLVRFAFEHWHELDPDLIHVHDFDSLQVGLLLRTAYSIPIVMTVHRAPTEWWGGKDSQDEKACFMEVARVHKFVDQIVVPSKASKRVLTDQGFRAVQIVPHGISQHLLDFQADPSVLAALRLPADADLIFCPSRADEHKDVPVFIRGAAQLRNQLLVQPHDRRVIFLVTSESEDTATPSPESMELHSIAKSYGLIEGQDIFLTTPFAFGGPLSTIYRRASVVVVPSLHESFGQTILDAFMFGKPVVARARTGLTEIVHNKINGLLFENPNGLAFQMRLALSNKQLVTQIVENAKQGLEKQYSVERMVREYRRLYDKVTKKRPPQPCG